MALVIGKSTSLSIDDITVFLEKSFIYGIKSSGFLQNGCLWRSSLPWSDACSTGIQYDKVVGVLISVADPDHFDPDPTSGKNRMRIRSCSI
jgi:hypothetical protein